MKTLYTFLKFYLFANFFLTANLYAQSTLIRDLVPGKEGMEIGGSIQLGNKVIFLSIGNYPEKPRLGITDGTKAGTKWLKTDLKVKNSYSFPFYALSDKILFFTYDADKKAYILWATDGTAEGTLTLTREIKVITADSPVIFQDMFVFMTEDSMGVSSLWKTNGTASGTTSIATFNRTLLQGSRSVMHPYNGDLYISTSTREGPGKPFFHQIWRLDGSNLSLSLLIDRENFRPSQFTHNSNTLFFIARDDNHGFELWGLSSQQPTPFLIRDIYPGDKDGLSAWNEIHVLNDQIYFTANDSTHGGELWKSDGTFEGTNMVKDLRSDLDPLGRPIGSFPKNFRAVNGKLLFTTSYDSQLYQTDGSEEGTGSIMDFQDYRSSYTFRWHDELSTFHIFSIVNDSIGREFWTSDGTQEGTHLLQDIHKGMGSVYLPYQEFQSKLFPIGSDKFIFSAHDGLHGFEPWISDGTETGTRLVENIFPGAGWSMATSFYKLGEKIICLADDGITGLEWRELDIDYSENTNPDPFASWSEKIGPQEHLGNNISAYLNDLIIDTEDNIISSLSMRAGYRMHFFNNQTTIEQMSFDSYAQTVISSFTPTGDLLWAKSFSAGYLGQAYLANGPDNSVFVAGTLLGKAIIDSLEINLGRSNEVSYVAKFAQSGELEWISNSFANNSGIDIDAVTSDEEGNVYVAGRLTRTSMRWGDVSFDRQKKTSVFLFRLSPLGNIIWGELINDEDKEYRKIADIEVNADGKPTLLYTWQTSDTVSNKVERTLHIGLRAYDTEGAFEWERDFNGIGYHTALDLESGHQGDLMISGSFSGSLKFDQHTTIKAQDYHPYFARLSKDGEVLYANKLPFKGSAHQTRLMNDGSYYVLGYGNGFEYEPLSGFPMSTLRGFRRLFIYHFDYWNRLLAKKEFYLSPYDRDYYTPKMAINSTNEIISGTDYIAQIDSFGDSWSHDYGQHVYLMQFTQDRMEDVSITDSLNQSTIPFFNSWEVGPNPSSGTIWIHSQPEALRDFDYEIFSAHGQLLESGEKTGGLIRNSISLSSYPPGMYLVVLSQENKHEVYKILRQ